MAINWRADKQGEDAFMEQVSSLFYHWKGPEFPDKVTPLSFWKDLIRKTVTNTLILFCSKKIHSTFEFSSRKHSSVFWKFLKLFLFNKTVCNFYLFSYQKTIHLALISSQENLEENQYLKILRCDLTYLNDIFINILDILMFFY